jgi:type I restriction enzyme S subunit
MEVRLRYKQTAVGVIPESWDCSTVRGIASKARNAVIGGPFGSELVSSDYKEAGVPVIRGQNLSGRWVSGPFVFVTAAKASSLEANLVRPGDIVLTQRGTLGQVSIVPQAPFGSYLISQSQMKITVDRGTADSLFYFYVFTSHGQRELIRQGTIQTGVPHINLGILRDLPVQLPALPEQRTIAEALNDVDVLLEALYATLAKNRDLKQAIVAELLSGATRLPGFGRTHRTKYSEIGPIPADWEVGPLSRAIDRLDAGASVNSEKYEAVPDFRSHLFILKTGAVKAGSFNPGECKKVVQSDLWRLKVSLHKDTVLVSRMNTVDLVGESGYVGRDYPNLFVPDRMWMVTVRSGVVFPRWLSYVLPWRPVKSQISDAATGTSGSMKNISKRSFRAVEIPYPPEKEQRAIAEVLSDMDAEIAALEARRDKTRLLKQAMMQELLTGRTRLV